MKIESHFIYNIIPFSVRKINKITKKFNRAKYNYFSRAGFSWLLAIDFKVVRPPNAGHPRFDRRQADRVGGVVLQVLRPRAPGPYPQDHLRTVQVSSKNRSIFVPVSRKNISLKQGENMMKGKRKRKEK